MTRPLMLEGRTVSVHEEDYPPSGYGSFPRFSRRVSEDNAGRINVGVRCRDCLGFSNPCTDCMPESVRWREQHKLALMRSGRFEEVNTREGSSYDIAKDWAGV